MLGVVGVSCALVLCLLLEVAGLSHFILQMCCWLTLVRGLATKPVEFFYLSRRALVFLPLRGAINRFKDICLIGTF